MVAPSTGGRRSGHHDGPGRLVRIGSIAGRPSVAHDGGMIDQRGDEAATRRHGGRLRVVLRRVTPPWLRRGAHRLIAELAERQLRWFERRYRIEVRGQVALAGVEAAAPDRVFYDAAHWLPLRRALRARRLGPNDVVVDLGAGKGAAVVVAATFPVRRVIGVEVADALAATARANVGRAQRRLRAAAVQVVTAAARRWPVPDDVTTVFLYCPFTGAVFAEVLEHLLASLDRRPRPLHLIYAFPTEHNMVLGTHRAELVAVGPAQWPAPPWWPWSGWVTTTYRLLPAGIEPKLPRPRGGPLRRAALRRWCHPTDQEFTLRFPTQATGPESTRG